MRRVALAIATLGSLLAIGPLLASSPVVAQSQPHDADPLVGCYDVTLGEWSPLLSSANAPRQTPPSSVRLTAELGDDDDGPFERDRALVRPVLEEGHTPSAYWLRRGDDAVHVVWTGGFSGVRLELRETDDGLRGTAEAFTDVAGVERPTAEVTLRPVDCPDGTG